MGHMRQAHIEMGAYSDGAHSVRPIFKWAHSEGQYAIEIGPHGNGGIERGHINSST